MIKVSCGAHNALWLNKKNAPRVERVGNSLALKSRLDYVED